MQKLVRRGLLLAVTAFFAVTLLAPVAVSAIEGRDNPEDSTTSSNDSSSSRSELKEKLEQKRAERKSKAQERLTAAKQQVCENRKEKIAAIMKRAVTRAENHVSVFDKITTRVKDFYTKKGNTLANYDELVAAVDAAKAKAVADIETLKTLDELDCSSEDPKGNAEDFKTALGTVKEDLKAYRTAVKNLIVGVKSVQGGE
jgi:hypothetical protein